MKLKLISCCLIVFLSQSVHASNSSDFAQELQTSANAAFEDISQQMAVQVNLSGKQRMLTQKMSKEALLIAKKIKLDENKKQLKASMELFEKTLTGLKDGDESLKLVKTTEDEILAQLKKVDVLWKDFKPSIETVMKGEGKKDDLLKITEKNLPLLAEMNNAVAFYEMYSGAEHADAAKVINLAGKQRMLTQKMTKELLLIANNLNSEENKKNLATTTALFEKTLAGLAKGDKELGLSETKDAAILKQLEIVKSEWEKYKPIVESNEVTDDKLAEAAEINLVLLKEMNKAVTMYEKAASIKK